MSTQKSVAMANVGSATSNTAVDVSRFETASVYVSGTFVATYSIMESGDGTNFAATHTGKTAGGIFELSKSTKQVKITATAWTSGTIVSHVGGRDDEKRDLR